MTDYNKSIFLDLNFRTALLESVDWDQDMSGALLVDIQTSLSHGTHHPKDILENIRQKYGDDAFKLVKNVFSEVYIDNGFYQKLGEGDDYEH